MAEAGALFLTALLFYTRLPVGRWVTYSEERQRRSIIFLPLVGWLVGAITAEAYYLSTLVFSQWVAILLSTALGVLMTGALHEDGFADVCDGFGGGWDKATILRIMKDSQIGAYGAIGLMLMLSLKVGLLVELDPIWVMWGLVIAHSLSRLTALSFVYTHTYARPEESSKVGAAARPIQFWEFNVALVLGVLPLVIATLTLNQPALLGILAILYGLKWGLGQWFVRKIGGYTGDCLGATQQLAELAVYLWIAAVIV